MSLGENPTCQHRNIDSSTSQCESCQEQMIGVEITYETVKSAPNLVPGSGIYESWDPVRS